MTERKMVLVIARMKKEYSILFPNDPTDAQILKVLLHSKYIEIERIHIDESITNEPT